MDTRENILSRIIPIISEKLGVNETEITPEAKYFEDLGCDSLDQVELMMEAEIEFGINIGDDAMTGISTIEDSITLIQSCQETAAEKKKKRQEEIDRKIKELGPVRLAWSKMEEGNCTKYIKRTGHPYFVYDGTPSTDDGSFQHYLEEKSKSIEIGKFNDWLLDKASWFIGHKISTFDVESVSDVLSMATSIRQESYTGFSQDQLDRFGNGFHFLVTPDGQKKEGIPIVKIAEEISRDVLSTFLSPFMQGKFTSKRTGRKDASFICEGSLSDATMWDNEWALEYSYTINGKSRKYVTTIIIDPFALTWKSKGCSYDPVGRQSEAVFGKINKIIHRISGIVEQKVLLERISFHFGIFAKSITLSLAARVARINDECARLCDRGGTYLTKDGRSFYADDILNPSSFIPRQLLSVLIAREGFEIDLELDDEPYIFVPNIFHFYYIKSQSVFLKGQLFGKNSAHTMSFELSLCGKKCRRITHNGWNFNYVKGQVSLPDNPHNGEIANKLIFMLEQVYQKRLKLQK